MFHGRKDYDERIQDSAGLIPKDEPVLLLRGQDRHAADALRYYAYCVASDPEADPVEALRVVAAVLKQAHKIDNWPTKKLSDLPKEM